MGAAMSTPLSLSDDQLESLLIASEPLAPSDRASFIEAAIAELNGTAVTPASLRDAITKAQQIFLGRILGGKRRTNGGLQLHANMTARERIAAMLNSLQPAQRSRPGARHFDDCGFVVPKGVKARSGKGKRRQAPLAIG
jgi:hypothetical protein